MRDIYSPDEVLVKRSDLLPVDGHNWQSSAEELRHNAMRLLSAAVQKEDAAAKESAKKAKEWELEHVVPLARTMYNAFYNFTNSYREDIAEAEWLKHYEDRTPTAMAWVSTASAVLKAQEGTGE